MCEEIFPAAKNLAASITENIGQTAAWRVMGTDDPLTRISLKNFTTATRSIALHPSKSGTGAFEWHSVTHQFCSGENW
jgi:hypothetical protein